MCGTQLQTTGLVSASPKVSLLPPRQELNSPLFLKSSAHASSAWHHSHPLVLISIWGFYFDISEWHILSANAWTPALMLYLTNPCTKRKVLILTKLKGKIYKIKSLRHYITPLWVISCQIHPCWRIAEIVFNTGGGNKGGFIIFTNPLCSGRI